MATVDELRSALREYQASFRRSDVALLEISGIYVLYPGSEVVPPGPVAGDWLHDDWPHHDRRGVYVLIDENCDIVYVGKASWGPIGARLATYFQRQPDGSCRLVHDRPGGWRKRPAYVIIIAVPETMPF